MPIEDKLAALDHPFSAEIEKNGAHSQLDERFT
jgi:hypothetical protein